MRYYSIIIPVYNRPDEIEELLQSLTGQTFKNFEVIIIEDGSDKTCKSVIARYKDKLTIQYYFKENTGQGFSRNLGFEKANGDYFIVFDSDCFMPKNYLQVVDERLNRDYLDAFGGPDEAAKDFTLIQKAINYSMTSIFTTGGIRGNKKHTGTFHPRSFNMGISKEVFINTGGYKITRMGEDIELSIRIIESGYKVGLIEEAFVYHKRRANLFQFYSQLHFFGRARINITRFFPKSFKLVHLFPLAFSLSWLILVSLWFTYQPAFILGAGLLGMYYTILFVGSTIKNRNLVVGFLSIVTATIQLIAYANGMIYEFFRKGET